MKTIHNGGMRRMQTAKCKLKIANCRPSPCVPRRVDAAAKRSFPNPQPRTPSPASRSGVLLLIVLAVLALFALIAVAFVFITSQSRRSAESIMHIGQVSHSPKNLLDQAAMQVFRGPTTSTAGIPDPASVIGGHDLLDDIYGNEYLFGTFNGSAAVAGFPQLVNFPMATLSYYNAAGNPQNISGATALLAAWSRRLGCVLTITGVPAGSSVTQLALVGQSTRILAVNVNTGMVQVEAFSNGAVAPGRRGLHHQRRPLQRHGIRVQLELPQLGLEI